MDTLETVQKIEAAMLHDNWYYDVAAIVEKYVDARIEQKLNEVIHLNPPLDSQKKSVQKCISCNLYAPNDYIASSGVCKFCVEIPVNKI